MPPSVIEVINESLFVRLFTTFLLNAPSLSDRDILAQPLFDPVWEIQNMDD